MALLSPCKLILISIVRVYANCNGADVAFRLGVVHPLLRLGGGDGFLHPGLFVFAALHFGASVAYIHLR